MVIKAKVGVGRGQVGTRRKEEGCHMIFPERAG